MILKNIKKILNLTSNNQIEKQLLLFKKADDNYLASKVEALTNIDDLISRIKSLNIELENQKINIEDFEKWQTEYPEIVDHYKNWTGVRIEKLLEHYLLMKYTQKSSKETFIDVAASTSPWADILEEKEVYQAFKLDLSYPEGINGNQIGCNAGNIPVQDGFADILGLHCAFECFQGNSDYSFIKESERVLKKDGRLGIIPLYLDSIHFVKTSPYCDKRKINVEREARWIWRDDKYKEPFSRHYSPEVLKSRILKKMNKMEYKILHFTNIDLLKKHYTGENIYCYFMLLATKKEN